MSEVEWNKAYWDDGQIPKWEIPSINGMKHGVVVYYRRDGLINWKISFANGVQHGIERYYNNGIFEWENLWINGEVRNDLLGEEHRLERLMLLGGEV